MKKLLFVGGAIAMGVTLAPFASASTFTFNHITDTYTLSSENPADVGPNVSLVNAFIQNSSGTESLAITGFEYYFGGSAVSGAAGDTPSQFQSAANGWTYQLGGGAYNTSTAGTGWNKNTVPTVNGAVKPEGASKTDYLSQVALENSSSSGFCYTGEILAPDSECDVELLVTANFGGAIDSSTTTFIYGFAEGVDGKGTFNSGTDTWSKGSNTAVSQGMEESINIDVAPEPNSLLLFGTGFGVLGFGLFLRNRQAGSQLAMNRSRIV
jgi:hypothetical protein